MALEPGSTRTGRREPEAPTVLVTDDHPLWLSALERDLTGHGVRVVATAADGPAGLVLGEFRRMATDPAAAPDEGGEQPARPIPELTPRETEVLRLVATGMSSKEIAGRLGLSHRTVQNHVQNTLGTLHLHNRVELVRFALAHGLEDEE
jgi:DNA-binding NarL/FixJ family response regulator